MLNIHEIFRLELAAGADLAVELGFEPIEIEVRNVTASDTTKYVKGDTVAGISLVAGGTRVFYNDATVPTYKDIDGNAIANDTYDIEGNKVLDLKLPKLDVSDNENSYILKSGFRLDVSALVSDATGDKIVITAKR